jgi:hypothetical protein
MMNVSTAPGTIPANKVIQVTVGNYGASYIEGEIAGRLHDLETATGWTWNPISVSTAAIDLPHQFGNSQNLFLVTILAAPYAVADGADV